MLSDDLDVSNQTVSRRLQRLESAGLLEREEVNDGKWVAITENGERLLRSEFEDYRRIFDGYTDVELRGVLTSGMSEGQHYISLPDYKRQFRDRLEYAPFPGTLNVELDDNSIRRRSALSVLESVSIDGWEDDDRTYGPTECHPAMIGWRLSRR